MEKNLHSRLSILYFEIQVYLFNKYLHSSLYILYFDIHA